IDTQIINYYKAVGACASCFWFSEEAPWDPLEKELSFGRTSILLAVGFFNMLMMEIYLSKSKKEVRKKVKEHVSVICSADKKISFDTVITVGYITDIENKRLQNKGLKTGRGFQEYILKFS
ncbi:hypothetical protein ACJX0J_006030, partial [Zea mays]